MEVSKVKLKVGQIELEYEGSELFLKNELPLILKNVAELHQTSHEAGGNSRQGIMSGQMPMQEEPCYPMI